MTNPKRFTNFIVPLLRQSKRRKYFNDKTTAMIRNQCPLMDGFENVINKLWILHADLSNESSSPYPHKAIDFQAMRDTISGNTCISTCVKKTFETQCDSRKKPKKYLPNIWTRIPSNVLYWKC